MANEIKLRMNKKDFIRKVAKDNAMTIAETTKAYNALTDGVYNVVTSGQQLSLSGFGLFYLHKHKGHPVRFDGGESVADYVVFKFSASDVLNKRLRKEYDRGKVTVCKR